MYLTPKQAASRACVSVGLVYHWCQSGDLPCLRLGKRGSRGKILIDPRDLDGFLDGFKSGGRERTVVGSPSTPRIELRHIHLN